MPFQNRFYLKASKRHQRAWNTRNRAVRRYVRGRRLRGRMKRRVKPSLRALARSVRQLYRRDEHKYFYTKADNSLIWDSNNWTILGPLNNCPAEDASTSTPWKNREKDSVECNLRNIRIHFSVHASVSEGGRAKKYFVALVKTTNGIGTGITMPPVDDIYDPDALNTGPGAQNLLSRWETFRTTMSAGAEALDSTKFLKVWTGILSPQGGELDLDLNTSNTSADVPPTEGSVVTEPASESTNYTQTRRSQRIVKYSHKCLNAKCRFNAAAGAAGNECSNVHYYLVALGTTDDAHYGYRLNACIKTNFVDE